MYELEEGEFLEKKRAAKSIDELVASPHGGLAKAGDTASRYMELLIYTLKIGSIRNLSMVLTALLETKHKSVLRGIIKSNGVQVFAYMVSLHQHSFEMTPILRTTLRALQHLERHGVLRGGDLTCSASHFCMAKFSQTLIDLTKHSDPQVRTLASRFQELRFGMPRSHDQCKEAKKPILKMKEQIERRGWNQTNYANRVLVKQ